MDFGGENHIKNVQKNEIPKKNTMHQIGDLQIYNGDLEFFNTEKRKFGRKMALETHFGTYWTILEKSIFLAPVIGRNEWFTVKIAPSNGYKKTKNRSKYSEFW